MTDPYKMQENFTVCSSAKWSSSLDLVQSKAIIKNSQQLKGKIYISAANLCPTLDVQLSMSIRPFMFQMKRF